jgi:hypothetical protein
MALAATDAQRCRTIFNDFPQKSLGPVSLPARRVSMNMADILRPVLRGTDDGLDGPLIFFFYLQIVES